ncbi:MAG: SMC family ATPase [Pseudomonadales bacterium]
MRPMKLSMTAFGPFSGTEIIDFTKLRDNPLFLINGPTGSGKTTILDGICYALYGKTTGNERDASQMRCDQADAELVTQVELVFELAGTVYRIAREPEQHRPKKRGEGFTTHKARAELNQRKADGEETLLVAAKVQDATDKIEDLTGLSVEQFRQVMVLPQGEFRRLLTADSREREKVFSHLFQTHIYRRIEAILKDRSSTIGREVEASLNKQKGVLSSSGLETEAELFDEIEQQKPLLAAARKTKQTATDIYTAAQKLWVEASAIQKDYELLNNAQTTLSVLSEGGEEIDSQRKELARARQAIKLKPEQQTFTLASSAKHKASASVEGAKHQLEVQVSSLATANTTLKTASDKQPQLDIHTHNIQKLEAYRQRVTQLSEARRAQAEAITAQASADNAFQAETAKQLQNQQAQQDGQVQLAGMSKALKALPGLRVQLEKLNLLVTQRRERDVLADQQRVCLEDIQKQQQQQGELAQQLNSLKKHSNKLEMAWHMGQAALLAQDLTEGDACPVCGSEEHPLPATAIAEIPGDEQREAAKAAIEKCIVLQNTAGGQLATLNANLGHLKTRVEDLGLSLAEYATKSLDELNNERDLSAKVVAELELAEQQETHLAKSLVELEELASGLKSSLVAAEAARNAANTQLAVTSANVDKAEAEIPEQYRLDGALDTEIGSLQRVIASLQQEFEQATAAAKTAGLAHASAKTSLDHALGAEADAVLGLKTAAAGWQEVLLQSEFADENAWLVASRSDQQVNLLVKQIQAYDSELSAARGSVNALQQKLKGQAPPELETLLVQRDTAGQLLKEQEAAFAVVDKRVSQLLNVEQQLVAAKEANKTLEQQYQLIGTLSDVANGKTGNRISLQRFVLSVLLDDVLIEATARLKLMSKGRYELYRDEEKGKGGGASGLELMVEDAYNGKRRPVATLSGGESFMAALSLALGLSDVVQAYAGGIKLDTLFIDEGFGSLDPESLDLAINTLIDLQSSGRMVGIISHVPELKERISTRLDVATDRSGSRTSLVIA